MIKKLKLLLNLRAWIRSGGLKLGGGIAAIGVVETWLQTQWGLSAVQLAADLLNVMASTLGSAALTVVGLLQILSRLKTEWSVAEKIEGKDKE